MPLTLRELLFLPPEIAELARGTREMADNHSNSSEFYRSLATMSTWQGQAAGAAMSSMLMIAGLHDVASGQLKTAAAAMDGCETDAETVANDVRDLLNYAAEAPGVQVNTDTNQLTPPDTTHLDAESAQKVSDKVADLQARIAKVLAAGAAVDGDLAQAIATATGVPAGNTPTSLQDLLLPGMSNDGPLAEGEVRNLGPVAGTGAYPGIPGIGAADLGEIIELPNGQKIAIFGDSYSGDKQGDGTHYPSVAVPVTFDAQGRPQFGKPITGPDGSPNVLFPLPKAVAEAGANNALPSGSIQMRDGRTVMMVVGTNTNEGLAPKGGSWLVEVNKGTDLSNGRGLVPVDVPGGKDSWKPWESAPAPLPNDPNHRASAPGSVPSQISGFEADDGNVYIAADTFDRNQGVTMYRVDADQVTNRDAWQPWTGSDWGNPGDAGKALTGPGVDFGELSFREVDGRPVLSGFNAATGNVEVRVGDTPTDIFGPTTPTTVVAQGGYWGEPGKVPQNYGGYIMPGSTLDDMRILVSQWNTETGSPYTVGQFKVNPHD
ncbi:DUF4185 domain-containing protein [Mycolicibacterium fortuitum]|uniref:DUF4185 domain-containing protein n=2 Tax=Mycolicibacterium fortuitum TaxID=1766 RepID=A0AAE4VK00_MYCFO|nr:DUF4185 domain-containing protein [Mycolicibacterium fortuitum]MDV7194999.1 DUF4185 domain-containing protein [Mycolicibacterium fortuitum]MDV7208724.1 DUF4185 domain-containing protein [Mycolicibacterium fortuitum]MDV7230621.1 DUF4185 domain-containing protein [Mycolicibacterium fortuitum]MDV7262152.1 DUF4185 domain-containing protein [Mycolicibacterium fortuitum]MDV7287494.1 DUF4185 domain-containing protein [Mycolicibacterium fortuitum]